MKFYKINKSVLKFTEMNQVIRKWKYPILIDTENRVYLGNCIKDCLLEDIIVVIIDKNDLLYDDLIYIETHIADENSESRLNMIESEVDTFFKEIRKPVIEETSLFDFKEYGLITEDNFIAPPPYDFNKHKKGENEDPDEDLSMEELIERMIGEN